MRLKNNILTGVFLISSLAGGIALAQTTEAEAPVVGGELSMGEDLTNTPAVGQTYDKEVFGDWTLRCVKVESGVEPCQLFQLLLDGDGSPVAEYNISVLEAGGQAVAGANVVTPLETLLPAQLTIRVDESSAKRYPFAFCTQMGCVSRIGLTADDVNAYKRGSSAVVIMVPAAAPEKPVGLRLSLSGFTAGYDALAAN